MLEGFVTTLGLMAFLLVAPTARLLVLVRVSQHHRSGASVASEPRALHPP